jgi:hypothetical protein
VPVLSDVQSQCLLQVVPLLHSVPTCRLFTNKPHHLPQTVTVALPNTVAAPHQVPPQYAHHTPYIGCDLQIGLYHGSGTKRGVLLSVPGRSVGFMEDEVSLGQVNLRVIRFSAVSITPPKPHTHLHVHTSVNGRTSRRSMGKFDTL